MAVTEMVAGRWARHHSGVAMFWRFWHRPHVHRDRPVRLDGCFPDSGKNDLPIRSDQVVVAFCNMGAEAFDVQESLSY